MEKITMKEFEERIEKDEALMAKAKEIIGGDGNLNEKAEKILSFAASLGYEPELDDELLALSDDEMDKVVGGGVLTPILRLLKKIKDKK